MFFAIIYLVIPTSNFIPKISFRERERVIERNMMKLRSKKFCRNNFKRFGSFGGGNNKMKVAEKEYYGGIDHEIKWELRPGGMLVQKRDIAGENEGGEGMITIRVSTVSHFHDISVLSTSTFGELKMMLSMVSSMEPREQRLLFKGKEREDNEYLHMVGVRDKDKVLLLEDPAIKEIKLLKLSGVSRTISV